jgi:hypothetical protein
MFYKLLALCLVLVCGSVNAQVTSIADGTAKLNAAIALAHAKKSALEMTLSGVSQTANSLKETHDAHVAECPLYQGAFCYDWEGIKTAREAAAAYVQNYFFTARTGTINFLDQVTVIEPYFVSTSPLKAHWYGIIDFYIPAVQAATPGANASSAQLLNWYISVDIALEVLERLTNDLIREEGKIRTGHLLPLYQAVDDEAACWQTYLEAHPEGC